MSKSVISVDNLGKKYLIRHQSEGAAPRYRRLSEELISGAKQLIKSRKGKNIQTSGVSTTEEFWALKNVSFSINQGEVVGIIGRNGAGKSTLLKLLSRITEPSEGSIELRGRVASLLEVGTGFHPELTGRENIFLNGAVLGMNRSEIRDKFDEIVAFSGVEKFLDTPVKRFSSGMQTRLAFSVAAHLDPEILIIDEVLAVGDYEFQKRCLGKMREVSTSGRTVLFVSHNLNTIATLTHRCIHLASGNTVADGPTTDVIASYISSKKAATSAYVSRKCDDAPHIQSAKVITSLPGDTHEMLAPLQIELTISTPEPISRACLSIITNDTASSRMVSLIHIFDSEVPFCRSKGIHKLICRIDKLRLFEGSYDLSIIFVEAPGGRKFERIDNVCPFEVKAVSCQRQDYPYQCGEAIYCEDFKWEVHPPESK